MMKETGSNTQEKDKTIKSIQLSLDGLYLSPDGQPVKLDSEDRTGSFDRAIAGYIPDDKNEPLAIAIDTAITITLPVFLMRNTKDIESALLRANNVSFTKDQGVVISKPENGQATVMVLDKELLDHIKEKYGDKVVFTSPLLQNMKMHTPDTVIVRLSAQNMYLSMWTDKLIYSEVFPYKSFADILYYIRSLDKNYPLKNCHIFVYGKNAEQQAKLVSEYYKASVYADNKR